MDLKSTVTYLLAAIGAAWSLVQIWKTFAGRTRLTCTLESADFVLPASIEAVGKELRSYQWSEQVLGAAESGGLSSDAKEQRSAIRERLREATQRLAEPFELLPWVSKTWHLHVENKGNTTASKVTAFVAPAIVVSIQHDGAAPVAQMAPSISDSIKKLDLGELGPGHSVKVRVWSQSFGGADDFRVTHTSGRATVWLVRHIDGIAGALAENWPPLLAVVVMIAVFLLSNLLRSSQ